MTNKNILFLGTLDDKEYVAHLKNSFNGYKVFVVCGGIELLTHLDMYCKAREVTAVVTTNGQLLRKLVELQGYSESTNPSIDNYAGSVFTHSGREILFINPLRQLFTVSHGAFLAKRYISKLVAKDTWREPTDFTWGILKVENCEKIFSELADAFAIAVDIETTKKPLAIKCIGYTAVYIHSDGSISTNSYVLPLDSEWALAWMRRINALPIRKIFQNGKYDQSYLLRYNAPASHWFHDTAHFMHSWYSELPKDLAFLNAFFMRKVVYWKDLAKTNDLFEYYKYNALDTWATANVWIQQMLAAPDWVNKNYQLEFPLVYPCLLAEMTGLKRDLERLHDARRIIDKEKEDVLNSLRRMLGLPNFNPSSPLQVKSLLKVLGCGDIDSSNEKDIKKAQLRHPLNARILDKVLQYRGLRKLSSTYLRTDDDAKQTGIHAGEGGSKEFQGRILYSLNPHGTDTGRLASREHHFWTGLQIQNIPRGEPGEISWTKTTICADDNYFLAECDLEQAESRDTANISGDERLIAAVSGSRDFHSVNASAFFGVPYESIYDDAIGKTKDKKLRDLSKRVNHGANYNMGPGVLVDTMGLDKIWEAGRLLKLPFTNPIQIATYLLERFHETYPALKRDYYTHVINEVGIHRSITSRAFHHTAFNEKTYNRDAWISEGDWKRYCFGKPEKNKLDLNSYVAHAPQSLNARTLNEAFLKVFYEIALPNPTTFRLHAQIHDSILFSYAIHANHLCAEVRKCMEIPVTVEDVTGRLRQFTVPASVKSGTASKPAKYWSETE